MRRLALIILALLLLSGCSANSKAFVWQHVDTDVQVRPDGSLGVTETLVLRYSGEPFTFAFRELPNRRLDGISNISVGDGEHEFRQVDDAEGEEPYTFSLVTDDDTQRVRWVYPATTGGERTFVLRYDVAGAIRRYDAADEIWWSVVFPDREEVVEQASSRIVLPSAVPAEQLDATTPDFAGAISRAPGEVRVQASNIPSGQELTLRVRFPKGIVAGSAPAWQAPVAAQEAYDTALRPTVNAALSALAAGLLLLFGALIVTWWRRNRDPRPAGAAPREFPTPPEDLAPALAARLLNQSGGAALLATLFDLANRGYVTLRESKSGWRNTTTKLTATRTGAFASGLAPFETATLAALGLTERNGEVELDAQRSAIQNAILSLDKTYQDMLIDRGYLEAAGLSRRRRGITIGVILLIVGGLAFIPAAILAGRFSVWLPVVAGVVALSGLVWLCLGAAVRGVTQSGADALARWRAFQAYLKRLAPASAPRGQFDTLLPYAVAFGDAGRLTKAYSQLDTPLPVWFYPAIVGHGGDGPAQGSAPSTLLLHDFSQNFIAAISSASGSVGASGGAGAAGGASGGGSGGAG
jgi:hypothetical protein